MYGFNIGGGGGIFFKLKRLVRLLCAHRVSKYVSDEWVSSECASSE